MLLAGGIVGSSLGTLVFAFLRRIGQLDLVISLIYVIFLGTIGGLMLVESVRAIRRTRSGIPPSLKKSGQHNWIHRLPLKMRFQHSKLFVSVLPVLALGAAIGFLAAIMGVGGGIIMVPALIYLLKVPTNVVVGTSLFQIIFVAAFTTIVQSTANQTVDMVLALVLMLGGVAGAQYGARAGQEVPAGTVVLFQKLAAYSVPRCEPRPGITAFSSRIVSCTTLKSVIRSTLVEALRAVLKTK